MGMTMGAFDRLIDILQRAQSIVNIHRLLHSRGRPPQESGDLLRGAVVLAIAGLDSYVHETVLEESCYLIRTRRGANLPGKLVELVKENATHEKLLSVIYRDRPTSHLRTVIQAGLGLRTFQDTGQIEKAFKVLGIENLWAQVADDLGVREERARSYIQRFVRRRHDIVHRGDRNKRGVQSITRAYAEECIERTMTFALALDHVTYNSLD